MMNPKHLVAAIGLVLVLCMASPAAGANLVVNGSFEADPCTSGVPGQKLGLVGNAVTGWFIPASDGVYPWCLQNNVNVYGAGPTPYGNQWLVLGEVATGVPYTIQQTITGLTPGDIYKLSFAIASETGCCSIVEVSFPSGSSTAAQTFTAPASGQYWTAWATITMNFTATSSSATLQFKNLVTAQTGGIDLGLDNVDVESAAAAIQVTLISPPPDDQYVISDTPAMPSINATAKVVNVTPDPTATTTFTWKADLQINENGGTGTVVSYNQQLVQDTTTTGSGTYTLAFTDPTLILGGRLKLTATATLPNGKVLVGNTPDDLVIDGTNPQRSVIQSTIINQVPTRSFHALQDSDVEDVLQRIACRESGQTQFFGGADGGQGQPNVNSGNDIGVFQIHDDGSPDLFVAQPGVVFNWQTNVDTGVATYQGKTGISDRYPGALRRSKSYQSFITNTINPERIAKGLSPITIFPGSNFPTVGLIGSTPTDQLLEDAVRGYNGFAGPPVYGIPVLHEFIPDTDFLLNVPDNQLPTLSTNPNVWKRVCVGEAACAAARGTGGDPDYVEHVTDEAPECGG